MLRIRKPLLPEWRYWPAIPFVVLLGLCVAGSSSSLPPPKQQQALTVEARAEEKTSSVTADDRIADYTALLAWFTGVLAIASIAQGYFLIRADGTTKKAINLSRQQFISEMRPWIKVEATDIALCLDEGVLRGHVRLEATNVGKSPALKVRFTAMLIDSSRPYTNVGEISTAIYDGELKRANDSFFGFNIIPGQTVNDDLLTMAEPETEKITVINVRKIMVVLCATYSYLGGDCVGQTGAVCDLSPIIGPKKLVPLPRYAWQAFAESDSGRWCGRVT